MAQATNTLSLGGPPRLFGDPAKDLPGIVEWLWAFYNATITAGGLIQPSDLGAQLQTQFPIIYSLGTQTDTAADKLPYFSAEETFSLTTLTPFARTLIAALDVTAAQSILGITSGSVTHTGALTANQIVIGNGVADLKVLGSLGTTTTVLHGNAGGAPTFGAVSLSADVTGNLSVGNLNSGTNASNNTYWRGDGAWRSLPIVSVTDGPYGALGDGSTNDYAAFAAAIAALPATGGTIIVPKGAASHYVLGTQPTWGTKSIEWEIEQGVTFSGAGTGFGKFPCMATNIAQWAAGRWAQSQSAIASPASGGIATWSVEMIQPSSYVGQSVALYAGATGSSSNAASNVWAINCLIHPQSGAGGKYQCIEVDVNNDSAGALVTGVTITGISTHDSYAGFLCDMNSASWLNGIELRKSLTAVHIPTSPDLVTGVKVNAPAAPLVSAVLNGKQLANGADNIRLERATDSSPTGYYMRFVNAANSANLVTMDVLGVIEAVEFKGPVRGTMDYSTDNGATWNPGGFKLLLRP